MFKCSAFALVLVFAPQVAFSAPVQFDGAGIIESLGTTSSTNLLGLVDGDRTSWGWGVSGDLSLPAAGGFYLVLPTLAAVGMAGDSISLTLTLSHYHGAVPSHSLGHFTLSYTEDANPNFASTYKELAVTSGSSVGGANFQYSGGEVLVTGGVNNQEIYTITVDTGLLSSGITGLRIEAIHGDRIFSGSSMSMNGPGRSPHWGNFILSEVAMDADVVADTPTGEPGASEIPVSDTAPLVFAGLAAAVVLRLRQAVCVPVRVRSRH